MIGGRLAGKTCLLTGASRGLGRCLAARFWSEGANLVVALREMESAEGLRAELGGAPGRTFTAVALDLFDTRSARTLIDRAGEAGMARLDILVNNAAVLGPVGRAWENPAEAWEAAITANLVSPALVSSAAIPRMKAGGGGAIIQLSGGGASGPRPNFSAYAAAKAGLVRFSETLAAEVKDLNIRVNCIAPGAMGTGMLAAVERLGSAAAGEGEVASARKALAECETTLRPAADLALFLASDEGAGITGKLISAVWDDWERFSDHREELADSDVLTLRRIAGRDRGMNWCDK